MGLRLVFHMDAKMLTDLFGSFEHSDEPFTARGIKICRLCEVDDDTDHGSIKRFEVCFEPSRGVDIDVTGNPYDSVLLRMLNSLFFLTDHSIFPPWKLILRWAATKIKIIKPVNICQGLLQVLRLYWA